jgi:glycosyltransferase involved in cell wall biosynthesis
MRIVMLVDAVYEDAVGGSRVVAREVARRLASMGHAVTFVAPEMGKLAAAERASDAYRIERFPHGGPASLVREAARAAGAVLRREGADLLNVHFAYTALGLHLRPPKGIPIVRTFHGSWAAEWHVEATEGGRAGSRAGALCGRAARHLAEGVSLRRSQRVIVLSRFSREIVTREFGVPEGRIDLVPGGVDLTRFCPGCGAAARERLGLPPGARILFTVRRLVPRMGLDALLAAMPAVCKAHRNVLLLVGGRGPLADELARSCQALGLGEHVRFLGFIPDDELPLYYQAADAFVLPTRALEGFGLPTLEAFACGVPVLGTPVGATPELLRQVEPRLVLPGTGPEALATGVRAFLDAPLPESCRPERLRAFAERHSWERVAAETLAVFEKAALGARRSALGEGVG